MCTDDAGGHDHAAPQAGAACPSPLSHEEQATLVEVLQAVQGAPRLMALPEVPEVGGKRCIVWDAPCARSLHLRPSRLQQAPCRPPSAQVTERLLAQAERALLENPQ